MNFENFTPTLSDNLSAGVVNQLWTGLPNWRAYIEGQHPATMELVERFLGEDAQAPNIFKQPARAREPIATFSWKSPNGIWHQGALYLNGAVYRQVVNDYCCHTLLVDDATATARSYPEDGWVRLHELEVYEPE